VKWYKTKITNMPRFTLIPVRRNNRTLSQDKNYGQKLQGQ